MQIPLRYRELIVSCLQHILCVELQLLKHSPRGCQEMKFLNTSRWTQMAVSQDIITETLMGGKPYDIDFEALNVHR